MPLSTNAILALVFGTIFIVAVVSALFYFGCWRSTQPFQARAMRTDIDLEAQRSRNGTGLYSRGGMVGQSGGGIENSGRLFGEADDGFETRSLRGGKVVAYARVVWVQLLRRCDRGWNSTRNALVQWDEANVANKRHVYHQRVEGTLLGASLYRPLPLRNSILLDMFTQAAELD
ncbi:hypothetical protein FB567DRAFT_553050 [Paraphoma chrysanthemicola]|uniref:Uncharacterized protein n=1 Tax=Paraphoma chrysanthemicola TaxID=798071 RepID=A0A8K0VU24_9PLEO|nr:hypothetical protein FB567DRAFT_553050 [Paraphoma chrysanthemicola]